VEQTKLTTKKVSKVTKRKGRPTKSVQKVNENNYLTINKFQKRSKNDENNLPSPIKFDSNSNVDKTEISLLRRELAILKEQFNKQQKTTFTAEQVHTLLDVNGRKGALIQRFVKLEPVEVIELD
jgi:hypothetical protein